MGAKFFCQFRLGLEKNYGKATKTSLYYLYVKKIGIQAIYTDLIK